MSRLTLLKHSLPQIETVVPAREWQLSSEGRVRAVTLAQRLSQHDPDVVVTSPEPKATQTGEIVASSLEVPLHAVDGLHEHDRRDVGFLEKALFERSIADLFSRPNELVLGNETADAAYTRFSTAIGEILRKFAQRSVVAVTHGTVISLFVSRIANMDPFELWERLGLPSWVVLTHPELAVVEIVGSLGEDAVV